MSWCFLSIQVLAAAGGVIGGPIRIVGGLVDGDWGQVAVGAVGLLLGGAFAGMAYSLWSTVHARADDAPDPSNPPTD